MIPYVVPKRYIFNRDWKRKDTSENITLMRYRYNKIDDFLSNVNDSNEKFSQTYLREIDDICLDVEEIANKALQRIVAKNAYVQYVTGEADQVSYIPTMEFPESLRVICSVGINSGALHFDIEFNYQDLTLESYDGEFLPAHSSIFGKDVRKDMADILNTPISYDEYDYDGKHTHFRGERKGRWYEAFDKWFRTFGEKEFLTRCKKRGLI